MSQFMDTNGLLFTVVLIAQGVLVLFFFIAPVTGIVVTRAAQKKTDLFLVLAFMLLVFNVLFAGVTYLLQNEVAGEPVSDDLAGIIGLIVALLVTALVGQYLRFVFVQKPRSLLDMEREMLEHADDEEGTIFDQRRRERLKKRAQRGRR